MGSHMSSVSGKKLLIIAIVCGVVAATMGWLYLKAKESQYKAAYRPAQQVKVAVIVPRADIGKSQTVRRDQVAVLEVPNEYLPSNVVSANDWPQLEGRMTIMPLQRGRPITWDAIEQDHISRFSENVALGKRVKTVKISKINSFDGMLRPGDRIDLLGSFSASDVGLQQQPNYADDVVMTVLEDVEVLAAGREDAKGRKYENFYDKSTPDGFNMNFSTLSLMLTPAQVARVELAEKAGELVAVLRHPKETGMAPLGQLTVSSLLDPPPVETVDVVLDADGNLIGRIVGDNIVDANGRITGKVVDGQAIGIDGKVMGRVVRGLSPDDPLLRMRERATVVRDAQGNVIGRVVDGKVVDAQGNPIGTFVDGKAIGLDGRELGRVERNAALDEHGRVIDMSASQVKAAGGTAGATEQQVVRDAEGRIMGRVVDGKVVDAQGNVIGNIVDGKAVGTDGQVLGTTATVLLDENGRLVGENGEIARGADGKILGRVVDGKLVDADGKVLGTVKDGQVVDAQGNVIGKLEQAVLDADGKPIADAVRVVRDANGNVIGSVVGDEVIDAQGRKVGTLRDGVVYDQDGNPIAGAETVLQKDAQQVVRDASGNVIGSVRGDTVYDASGKAVGKIVDGKLLDSNGNVLARGVTLGVEAPRTTTETRRQDASRMIQFIPGGTGKQGVIPIQTLRLE
ncbi:Flp pilus assembly protein CpaB [Pseudomonas dryadis]|uniref:Flp pilus assembly protein CpaB n=2 Tax=Phytopseudomonas dryadis TaxID=2487520 RepID=A0A4Q9R5U5_9GAMM|nr:Flp pilus assembly protein CpaB [Pseudomonas dryadis]